MKAAVDKPLVTQVQEFLRSHSGHESNLAGKALPFSAALQKAMAKRNISGPELYNSIAIDRKLYSKIMHNPNYTPSKVTIILLCLGLQLTLEEAAELLALAGYTLSQCSVRDLIVTYCLQHRIYDTFEVNDLVEHFGGGTLYRWLNEKPT